MKNYCQNCGHDCHCGEDCIKEYDKGTQIICCGTCRHEKQEEKITNPEDLFNGA
jgi:hypothetical protein